jgi:hypothetical protein
MTIYIYQNSENLTLKWIYFNVCKLYINKVVKLNAYETMQKCCELVFINSFRVICTINGISE